MHDGLTLCGLPARWHSQDAWTVLDASFGQGETFVQVWQAWRDDLNRSRVLHYVGIAHDTAQSHLPGPLAAELKKVCTGLSPGFHRILLDEDRVCLTLCLGKLHPALEQQDFQCDALFLDAEDSQWDKWSFKLLARRSKRGTLFYASRTIPESAAELQLAGFKLHDSADNRAGSGSVSGEYNPSWTLKDNRGPLHLAQPKPGNAAVIGAGLAGASVARALATRGWRVTVYDAHPTVAAGASGLPVGLVVPHRSTDDNPRSRLSRTGARLLLQQAARLLHLGEDWAPSGVMEMLRGASEASDASYWHAQAAWIKPGQMVRAWLAHPSIHNQCGTAIERLLHNGSEWTLIDASGQVVGRADVVVCANAIGVGTLLAPLRDESTARPDAWGQLEALHPMHGTVSHGPHTPGDAPHMPAHPVNGHGSFVPNIPTNNGMRWYAGATFEATHSACNNLSGQHEVNRLRLAQLWPQAAVALDGAFAAGGVEHWTGTRCVTHDRLPLVGPLSLLGQESAPAASLWVCVGMGSRGLSFSALCAQLLVARLCGEPLPVESKLARSLDANRSIRRRALPPPA